MKHHFTTFCWSDRWLHVTNLNPLQILHGENFSTHTVPVRLDSYWNLLPLLNALSLLRLKPHSDPPSTYTLGATYIAQPMSRPTANHKLGLVTNLSHIILAKWLSFVWLQSANCSVCLPCHSPTRLDLDLKVGG